MNIYDQFVWYYEGDYCSYLEDIPFYREMAFRTGDPILEMMCGTGRVLLPLAEAGHTITGVDSSLPMLDLARSKVAAAGLSPQVTLLHGDVCSIALPAAHFSLAFVALDSFLHLVQVEDQLAALATMHRALMHGGILILDIFNADLRRLMDEDTHLLLEHQFALEDRQVFKLSSRAVDLATQTMDVTYFYDDVESSGQVTRHVLRFPLHWFSRYELEHLLARAGFHLLSIYGGYDVSDYRAESDRLIVVATPQRESIETP
jgi:ubiquinone/menaquinone biosynthesis C-methylase UbiE